MKSNRNLAENLEGLRTALLFFFVGFKTARNVDWGQWVDWAIFALYFGSFGVQVVAGWYFVERPNRNGGDDKK